MRLKEGIKMKREIFAILILSLLIATAFSGCITKKGVGLKQHQNPNLPIEKRVKDLLKRMTLEEKVGQMVQVRVLETIEEGFVEAGGKGFSGIPSEKTKEMIQKYHVGSVIIYSTLNPKFTAEYTNRLQQWAKDTRLSIPLLIAADFETGPGYNVFGGATFFPQQMGVAATRSTELAKEIAKVTAQEARAMGIHWNYSPISDVNTNYLNPVIGVRSFGDEPDLVSEFVEAYVEGYQANGMIATAKHYPGHGDTSLDSHLQLPKVTYGIDTLEEVHLKPFQSAIDSEVKSIMTAHILVEQVDENYPATLSQKILTGLLREQQNYKGIIVTDAMSMGGISKHFGVEEASVLAVKAGADVVMATGSYEDQVRTYEAILNAAKKGEISERRIDGLVSKILKQKLDLGLFEDAFVDPKSASKFCGNSASQELALKAARRSITLLKNERGFLPLSNDTNCLLVTGPLGTKEIAKQLEKRIDRVITYETPHANQANRWGPSIVDIRKAKKLADSADSILVITYSSFKPPIPKGQVKLVEELKKTNKPIGVIALGLPYDIASLPPIDAYLATYALNRWGAPNSEYGTIPLVYCQAIAEVICGNYKPTGKLPVTIPDTKFGRGSGLSY
jgi:beta-N-acetylhexosaminidase